MLFEVIATLYFLNVCFMIFTEIQFCSDYAIINFHIISCSLYFPLLLKNISYLKFLDVIDFMKYIAACRLGKFFIHDDPLHVLFQSRDFQKCKILDMLELYFKIINANFSTNQT